MDDRQIQDLVRMTIEIERFEQAATGEDAVAPIARIGPQGTGAQPRLWRRLVLDAGLGLAAAACLVVGFVVLRPSAPAPVVKPGPAVTDARKAHPERSGGSSETRLVSGAEKCVVMAMYHDTDGHCSCVQMQEPEWNGGRQLAEVPRSELHSVALRSPCSSDAQQVLIVAVSGRPETLPRSREEAEAITQGVSRAAASVGRHADLSSLAYAAMPGLSQGSTVVAENVSMRQTSRVKDLMPEASVPWK